MKKTPDTTMALIVDAAPEAMLVLDASGALILVNRNAELLFGTSSSRLVNSHVSSLFPTKFPVDSDHVTGLLLTGQRRDGETFEAEISTSSFNADSENMTVVIIRDVSTRSELEAKLRPRRTSGR